MTGHAEPLSYNDYNINDSFFAGSFSYLAGTNEEALFRGWWPQFVLGWYFGYLTQKNEWTLREAIFIHA